jgi:hypothetical protein
VVSVGVREGNNNHLGGRIGSAAPGHVNALLGDDLGGNASDGALGGGGRGGLLGGGGSSLLSRGRGGLGGGLLAEVEEVQGSLYILIWNEQNIDEYFRLDIMRTTSVPATIAHSISGNKNNIHMCKKSKSVEIAIRDASKTSSTINYSIVL